MTAEQLLAWIGAVLLLQVSAGLGIAILRHRRLASGSCRANGDYARYTCYGCHEHRPAKVRTEHIEEGIRDFENCVACHRSAEDEPRRGGDRKGRERGWRKRRDPDEWY